MELGNQAASYCKVEGCTRVSGYEDEAFCNEHEVLLNADVVLALQRLRGQIDAVRQVAEVHLRFGLKDAMKDLGNLVHTLQEYHEGIDENTADLSPNVLSFFLEQQMFYEKQNTAFWRQKRAQRDGLASRS